MEAFPSLLGELEAENNEDAFWPSFTDIMMVVVMIFLISTTLLIVRNVELVRSLTETAAAEKEAQQATLATLAENLTLEERVAALEALLLCLKFKLNKEFIQEDFNQNAGIEFLIYPSFLILY